MKLIILDRDGVINYESIEYIKTPEEWIPIPGSLEAIARLTKWGYTVVVATNQSGVGRGLYDLATLEKIHEKMHQGVQALGGSIAAIFFCPHIPDEQCNCRKPKPGLLRQIETHFKIDLKGVIFIGDTVYDIEAARAMGCRSVLVKTGRGLETLASNIDLKDIPIYNDLAEAVDAIKTSKNY